MPNASLDRHRAQDLQSLLMHQEAVRLLIESPALVDKLQMTLKRWKLRHDPNSLPLLNRWEQIICTRDWAAACAETDEGQQLRQASPLPTLLTEGARLAIVGRVKALKAGLAD